MTYIEQSSERLQSRPEELRSELSSGYAFTPYPSMTLSQRLELNKILHTNDITNNNISTFSDQDIIEPEPVEQEQEKVMGCCTLM